MKAWWIADEPQSEDPKRRAVGYCRHSAHIGQENSVEIQQDNIIAFAKTYGITIIHQFTDRGISGLNAEDRPAFNEMMDWVRTRQDFLYILVLDITRWGRFQDTDLSAHYESICRQHGKQVIYTNIGFPKDGDQLVTQLRKSIDRYQSADFSRVLSKKVFEGAAKVASQGYRPGSSPRYGFHRLMLDETKKPDRILNPGQRKGLQNGRIILVAGEPAQVEIVQEIFHLFVERGFTEGQIAGLLNSRGVPSPGGVQWRDSTVRAILMDEQYSGCVVYNKTTKRLKTKRRRNDRAQWVLKSDAYDKLISPELFQKAQEIFRARARRYDPDVMLANLRALYEKYGIVTSQLIRYEKGCPAPGSYTTRFGGMTGAFQAMFGDVLVRVRDEVTRAIGQQVRLVDTHDDFIVINQSFTILIQPAVPVPDGYGVFWAFRPDHRPVIDITLGVMLADTGSTEILGYLALPRLMVPQCCVRLSGGSDVEIELHGYNGLDLIRELTRSQEKPDGQDSNSEHGPARLPDDPGGQGQGGLPPGP